MGRDGFRHIALRPEAYDELSKFGGFHESFSDIVEKLISEVYSVRGKSGTMARMTRVEKRRVPRGAQVGTSAPSGSKDASPNTEENPPAKEELAHHVG